MSYDFDAWRTRYDAMTYADHVRTYSELWKLFPVQQHFDGHALGLFLDQTSPERVLEVGGWDGELAAVMLATCPWITTWDNVEICLEARDASICFDKRYRAVSGDRFLWEMEGPFDYDALVMSHSAEHMRWTELRALLEKISCRAVYLAAPLPTDGSDPDWKGYPGTHILEVGWNIIGGKLVSQGMREMALRTHEVRCWQR